MKVSEQGNWMDKLFHKKLSSFEVSPEDHIWEGIAKRLDQSQKRPGLFGSWWTVLLSVIMFFIVSGAGAYLLYKKAHHQKADKGQNKDLPFLDQNKGNEGTALLNSTKIKTEVITTSIPDHKNKQLKISKAIRTTTLPKLNDEIQISVNNESSDLQAKVSSNGNDENTAQSDLSDPLNANELIASTDNEFFPNNKIINKEFSYAYLPLKESFLRKENSQLSTPSLMDGCNVYRNNSAHFFLDVYYAPEIANRSLTTLNPSLQSYVEKRANSEKPILSYSAGIKASFVFGNGLAIRTGLSYSNNTERFDFIKETQTIKKEIFDNQGHLTRTEYTELVIMDKVYNSYKFLDMPILLGYERDLKDFILSINGGVGINLSSSQTGKIYKDVTNTKSFYLLENNGEVNQPIFRTNAGFSLIGSIGLNYKYNERIMILLEPSARYYLHSLSDPSNQISQNYLFLGMNVGLRYRIK